MRSNDERQASADERRRAVTCPEPLIVASNRQPYRHEFADGAGAEPDADASNGTDSSTDTDAPGDTDGNAAVAMSERSDTGREITVDEPAGGLTAGLDPVLQESGGTWIAWGDGDADELVTDENDCVRVPPDDESYTLRRIWLSEDAVDSYYYGFSNRVLWPICHEFPSLVEDRPNDFRWYRAVNRQFADAVAEHATADAVVWLQDYHLALAPAMIRDATPRSTTIAQFWHIPWPSTDVYRHCTGGRELLEGLLGNDLLGFHVSRYVDKFLDCVSEFVPGATVDRRNRSVRYRGSETRLTAEPMGVDADGIDERSRSLDGSRWDEIRERYDIPEGVAIGLGVDRLDYSKGIPERLEAVERLLERYPEWRGSFTFVQKATPSRTDIPAYQSYGQRVRNAVERINDRFATDDWRPIVYTEDVLPREELDALYRRADAMLVSPLLDGMNLVAQEFVAASVDCEGALVLSERAGAHELLSHGSYTIDPRDTDAFATTIHAALTAPAAERRQRMSSLRRRVFDGDLQQWMDAQFDEIERVRDAGNSRRSEPNGKPRSIGR